jgi:hypothetical protein
MAVLETMGVPTVTVSTTAFAYEASAQWQGLGYREPAVVEVRHPFGHLPPHAVEAEAARILPEVARLLTADGRGAA